MPRQIEAAAFAPTSIWRAYEAVSEGRTEISESLIDLLVRSNSRVGGLPLSNLKHGSPN